LAFLAGAGAALVTVVLAASLDSAEAFLLAAS